MISSILIIDIELTVLMHFDTNRIIQVDTQQYGINSFLVRGELISLFRTLVVGYQSFSCD